MQFLRDYGDTEVGGFGIAAPDDLLRIEDVQLVTQDCSWAHVAFDDASVADFFDRQVDAGRRPEQFGRIWVHTHPGDCPRPSRIDEETFDRAFGNVDWAVMFILAREGEAYARLRYNVGPPADLEIPVGIDYTRPFEGCRLDLWEQEYLAHVRPEKSVRKLPQLREPLDPLLDIPFEEAPLDWYEQWFEYAEGEDHSQGATV